MKKFIQKTVIVCVAIIGIVVVAIIIPNIIVWKNGGQKPIPKGQIITHNGQNHLLVMEENGDFTPYLKQKDGSFRKIKLRD